MSTVSTPPTTGLQRRTWLCRLLRLVLLFVLAMTALLALLPWWLPWLLAQQGIQLEWQQARWSSNRLQLQQLNVRYAHHSLQARNLQLGWSWQKHPLQDLQMDSLQLHTRLPEENHPTNTDSSADSLAALHWLPRQLLIRQLDAEINGLAHISGNLHIKADSQHPLWQPKQLELDLVASHLNPDWLHTIPVELQPEQLRIRTLTHPDASLYPDALQVLSLDIHSQGRSHVQLSGILSLQAHQGWQGRLEQAQLYLQLPGIELGETALQHLETRVQFSALATSERLQLQLEQPARLTLGQLQMGHDTQLQQLDIQLAELELDASINPPANLKLQTTYQTNVSQLNHPQLPNAQLHLSGLLNLQGNQEDWHARLEHSHAQLQASLLEFNGISLQKLDARLPFAASLTPAALHLQLENSGQITLAQLQPDTDSLLRNLQLKLSALQLHIPLHDNALASLQADYRADIDTLEHPLLHPQSWHASGTLQGPIDNLGVSAALNNTSGLQLDSQWTLSDTIKGGIQLKEVFLRAGNPLQASLTDWPELVEFNKGKLNLNALLELPNNQPVRITGEASGSGLGGILNRSELDGLDFNTRFQLHGDNLQLDLPRLGIAQLNPGVPITQLRLLSGQLRGRLDQLDKASFSWEDINGQLLGGHFTLTHAALRLYTDSRLLLRLQGIQLQEALTLYPTEGLEGQAILDGSLPLVVSATGVFVEKGQLQARQPGQLKFQSEQVRALGKTNPGMQLITEALEDFHFSVLNSKLDYEPSGKLLFHIQLEGNNPAVEKGRPIHLNLNLEEDLPALLASIQLSNHVSETIQERIRQRLQKR